MVLVNFEGYAAPMNEELPVEGIGELYWKIPVPAEEREPSSWRSGVTSISVQKLSNKKFVISIQSKTVVE